MPDRNPYEGLPGRAFWRSGVAETSPFGLKDIYSRKFEIPLDAKIATAGSCFAQHISRHMRQEGYAVLDVEPAPSWLSPDLHMKYGYSTYSARYGNIYTVPQLLQLAKEVAGDFEPQGICWTRNHRYFDALRPAVEPDGHDRESSVYLHRQYHLRRVRELFRTMDLFIFTLGLTEAWEHKVSGTVYPTAPGVYAGAFDPREFAFVNYGFGQLESAFNEFLTVLASIRGGTLPLMILTVSPVPLTATATGAHVLPATTYSKSVLRALAGQIAASSERIDYFPSYEIVTNQAARGLFFENNLRNIRTIGVETVMRIFFQNHRRVDPPELSEILSPSKIASMQITAAFEEENLEMEVQCEEAILEAFGA